MSLRKRSPNTLLRAALTLAVSITVVIGFATAQASEREDLKEPLYRVSKSDDLVSSPAARTSDSAASQAVGARPIIDRSSTLTSPPPANNSEECCAVDVNSYSSSASSEIPAEPTPQQLLELALADAEQILGHIRTDVKDYTCIFIKRENVRGKVLPTECMRVKVRNRQMRDGQIAVPFSVYMKFVKPKDIRGREIVYVEGRHKNQVLAKEGGSAGRFLPSVWLNTNGRIAMKDNRYPVTEIGIENLAVRLIERGWEDIESVSDCEVTYANGAKISGRPCRVLTVTRPEPKRGPAAARGMNVNIAQVFIDSELNIPVRYGAYDWPESPGSPNPVIEEYTYQNIKTNVGLTDLDFDYKNPAYNF